MAVYKCKMCGGALNISEDVTVIECDFCGTTQTVPNSKDENIQGLFNRANTLRMKSEFDKAEQIYEKIIQSDCTQAEAYWGMVLCKFGIEYVEDPISFKRIPTCHRTLLDSIISDHDYKSALNCADVSQKIIYESEAKEINRLQKEIIELSKKEEPYDVFICYKESDNSGNRTKDSVIANDIYYQLVQDGFKVFYAAISLEDKLGSAYEPCIFAALNSAKVMLSIGTKPEYFNAVWVKNEWSRFLKIMKNDRSKTLIPCYKDMDAYELPEEFSHLQAQDMSKIGFINDIVRGINKLISKDEIEIKTANTNVNSRQLMLENDVMYEGETFADIPHGFGKAKYPNGDTYEGQWERGKRTQGKMIWATGGEWSGEFRDNKCWNGSGVCYNGTERYEGALENGERTGFGKVKYPNGDIYEGQWERGRRTQGKIIWKAGGEWNGEIRVDKCWNGSGVYYCKDAYYEGSLINCQREGQGKIIWKAGGEWNGEFRDNKCWNGSGVCYNGAERYEGTLENGERIGFGKVKYPNGDIYEGQWERGKRTQGKIIWKAGGEWSGEFQDDECWNGSGVCYYGSERYEGTLKNGERIGFGKAKYPNGDIYEGQWERGKRTQGKIIWKAGGEWNGEFRDDKCWNGSGVYYYDDAYYEGPLINCKREGQGKIIWKAGGEWNGEFQDDEFWNGAGVFYYSDSRYEGSLINCKREGQGKIIWKAGGEWNGEFRDNMFWNGAGVYYYSDSRYEGPFINGIRHGFGSMKWNAGGEWYGEFRNDKFWKGKGTIRYTNGQSKFNDNTGGCYIATCVYGSYDCPEVWVLRRYRDNVLATTKYGRLFIRFYYHVSPKIVKMFGHITLFKKIWCKILNKKILILKSKGFEDTPYKDK